MTRRPKRIDLHPKPPSKVAGDGGSTLWVHGLPTRDTPPPLVALRLLRTTFPLYSAPSDSSLVAHVAFWASLAGDY